MPLGDAYVTCCIVLSASAHAVYRQPGYVRAVRAILQQIPSACRPLVSFSMCIVPQLALPASAGCGLPSVPRNEFERAHGASLVHRVGERVTFAGHVASCPGSAPTEPGWLRRRLVSRTPLRAVRANLTVRALI